MTVIGIGLAFAATLMVYLASPHQSLRPAARHPRRLRLAATLAVALSCVMSASHYGLWAGLFISATASMLGAVTLPYLATFRRMRSESGHGTSTARRRSRQAAVKETGHVA